MGRQTFDNLQFKERRRTGVQAQLFALRRALAAKAQLVKNQQQQIDILGRELANACVRIATLEQRWNRDEHAWEKIGEVAIARARAASADMQRYTFHGSLDQAGAFVREHIDPKPPSDGVFDDRLHGDEKAGFAAQVAKTKESTASTEQMLARWRHQQEVASRITAQLTADIMARARRSPWARFRAFCARLVGGGATVAEVKQSMEAGEAFSRAVSGSQSRQGSPESSAPPACASEVPVDSPPTPYGPGNPPAPEQHEVLPGRGVCE